MNSYFTAGRLSTEEKEDILAQHRTLYDGYRTIQPKVANEQPLYVQDFAKDKLGAVLNNKGVAKPYTNVGINEQIDEVCDECAAMEMEEGKEVCSECGGSMMEGECSECGWKGEVGAMEEHWQDGDPQYSRLKKDECKECGGRMLEGECSECGYKMEGIDEVGHLDDIYDVNDLGNNEFDYVEGGGNKYGTFEKMHHMKGIKNEQVEDDYLDNFEDPDNEDDAIVGSDDLEIDSSEMYEQGYTGGGNAPDMDLSNIEPGYNFISGGPGDVYPTEGEVDEDECEECWDKMESAWADEEIEEANDISGVQGIYGDMEPAFDFDSNGPGIAGPYQHSEWGGGSVHNNEIEQGYEGEDEDAYWEKDLDDNELDLDISKFNPEDKSWEEISAYTGDDEFSNVDEDIRESFVTQKNKIVEMMNRMKVIK